MAAAMLAALKLEKKERVSVLFLGLIVWERVESRKGVYGKTSKYLGAMG
jgi:hypothetical protein